MGRAPAALVGLPTQPRKRLRPHEGGEAARALRSGDAGALSPESDVPMSYTHPRCAQARQGPSKPLGDDDRAMPPAGAPDRDRQVALSLGNVVRNGEPQVLLEPVHEGPARFVA